jgi:peptide-methionine (S)-S-oxide reductase
MTDNVDTAVLAGGCAWIMQHLLRQAEGVLSTRTGWSGGTGDNPTEDNDGGHAEAVEVIFDPQRLSYRALLELFFIVHRPDLDAGVVGSIYRSEIFYTSTRQQRVAEQMIRDVDASKHWLGKTVTRVTPAGRFWEMESEDQDYLQRFPAGCTPPFPRRGDSPETRAEVAR